MIGLKIKSFVKASGRSEEEIASEMGFSKQNLYYIFNRESIQTDVLAKLSKILKRDISEFFDADEVFQSDSASSKINEIKKILSD